jgi:hypothetical protein
MDADRGTGPELARIMTALAVGDGAAVQWLIEAHGAELVRTVRVIAADRKARLGADAVDELVLEAVLAIQAVAGAWRADGAPPWVWARARIRAAVDRHLGLWADELDHERHAELEAAPAPPGSEDPVDVTLARLARQHGEVALLQEGLELVASPRDRLVFVELEIQVAMGDPSPAVTVGALYGMKPASVRQQSRRTRLRLRALAETQPRFGPLADLAVVA